MITFGDGNLRIPEFAQPVYVVAAGTTDFRKAYPEKQMTELCMDAIRMAISDNELNVDLREFKRMVNFCIYSQFADHFGDQLLVEAKVHDYLGLDPLPNLGVHTGGATGGSSVLAGAMAVASGFASVVPVIGFERMDEVSTRQGNAYIASAACKDFESELGWSYTSYYAVMMRRYLETYHPPRETLARIAQKNHFSAQFSPFSQSPKEYTIQEILNAPVVSDPLTFPECCVMSTGASCIILANEEAAHALTANPILIAGIGAGSHTLRTADRRGMDVLALPNESQELLQVYRERADKWPGFTGFLAARFAARQAYGMAGIIDPLAELDILETHDAFTVSDIQTYEDIGLRPYGCGYDFIESGDAFYNGKLPTNLSGGLLGTMHAVGATGIFQIAELFWQLQNRWNHFHADPGMWRAFGKEKPKNFMNLQVKDATTGMAVSHAGTGSHVVCTILRREEF